MGEQKDNAQLPRLVDGVDLRALPIGPEEAFVLSRIDGRSKPSDLSVATGLTQARVLEILSRLASLGAVSGVPGVTASLPPIATPLRRKSGSHPAPTPGSGPEPNVDLSAQQQRDIRMLHEMLASISHYDLLGVSQQATTSEIKAAYFSIVGKYHPDRYFRKRLGSFEVRLEEIFARLTVASDTLGSEELRQAYDATLGPGGGPPPRRKATPQPGAAVSEPVRRGRPSPASADEPPVSRRTGVNARSPEANVARGGRPASSPRHAATRRAEPQITPQPFSHGGSPKQPRATSISGSGKATGTRPRPNPSSLTPRKTTVDTTGTSAGRRIQVKRSSSDATPATADEKRLTPPAAKVENGPKRASVAPPRARSSDVPKSTRSASATGRITSKPPSAGRRAAFARKLAGSSVAPPGRDSVRPSTHPSVRPGSAGSVPAFPKAPRAPRISEAPPSGGARANRLDGGSAVKALDLVRSLRPNDPKIVERLESSVAAARIGELGAEAQRRESAGRYYDAALLYARASEMAPELRFFEGAARCFLAANRDLRQAADYARRATDMAPKQVRLALLLARIYTAADMKNSAITQLQRALDREPRNVEAQTLLADLSRSKE